jgi:hypothetical protein
LAENKKQKENKMDMKRTWKAAGLNELLPAVIAFVLVAIVAAVAALILANFRINAGVLSNVCTVTTGNHINATSGLCANIVSGVPQATTLSPAWNSTVYGLSSIQTMTSFLPLLALVIIAAAIIGVVLLAFKFGGGGAEKY